MIFFEKHLQILIELFLESFIVYSDESDLGNQIITAVIELELGWSKDSLEELFENKTAVTKVHKIKLQLWVMGEQNGFQRNHRGC